MFVAMSRFRIANGMEEQVDDAFKNRPHQVDSVQGFVRMDVVRPVETPQQFLLITYWTDEVSYHTWHRSSDHHTSHAYIPKGLKLVSGHTEVSYFQHVCS